MLSLLSTMAANVFQHTSNCLIRLFPHACCSYITANIVPQLLGDTFIRNAMCIIDRINGHNFETEFHGKQIAWKKPV